MRWRVIGICRREMSPGHAADVARRMRHAPREGGVPLAPKWPGTASRVFSAAGAVEWMVDKGVACSTDEAVCVGRPVHGKILAFPTYFCLQWLRWLFVEWLKTCFWFNF